MESLIAKLTRLTYEFFGAILPGVFALLMFCLLISGISHAVDFDWKKYASSGPSRIAVILKENGYVFAALITLFVWTIGQVINDLARRWSSYSDKGWRRWLLKLGLIASTPTESYTENMNGALDDANTALGLRLDSEGKVEWGLFFKVSRTIIQEEIENSLISNYQNTYTLHRCLSMVCIYVAWFSLGAMLLLYYVLGVELIRCWPLATLFSVCGIAYETFRRGYERHWKLFGDSVIAELTAMLVMKRVPAGQAPPERSGET